MRDINIAMDKAMVEAKSQVRQGNYDAARDIYMRVLVQLPKHRKAKKELKALEKKVGAKPPLKRWELDTLVELYQRGELERALPMARHMISNHPEQPMLHNILGAMLASTGQSNEALQCYQKALAIEPEFSDALHNKGSALSAMERWPEAVEVYQQLYAQNPEDAELQYLLGMSLHNTQQMAEAVELYLKSTHQRPLFGPAHANRGSALWALGRTEEALQSLENALEIDLHNPFACHVMGSLLQDLGRTEEAGPFLAKASATT